jgi:hypothetical protein
MGFPADQNSVYLAKKTDLTAGEANSLNNEKTYTLYKNIKGGKHYWYTSIRSGNDIYLLRKNKSQLEICPFCSTLQQGQFMPEYLSKPNN